MTWENTTTVANNISVIVVSRLYICSCGPQKEYSSDNLAVGIFQVLFMIFSSSVLKCSSSISVTHSVVSWSNSRNGPRRPLSSLHERQSSLTSTQRFVLRRLRDRPPRYEDANQIQLEKPPAYQEDVIDSAVSWVLFYALHVPNCILLFFHALC